MNKNDLIIIDDFLDNVDHIRKEALLLSYTKSPIDSKGWKGYRCLEENELASNLGDKIKQRLLALDPKFTYSDFKYYFHYTLSEDGRNENMIHKDDKSDYAGVLYLSPGAPPKSGTSFYNDRGVEIHYLENIYNRLVIYPSNEWHSLKESFGSDINNGRLTFTFFCKLKIKNTSSLI